MRIRLSTPVRVVTLRRSRLLRVAVALCRSVVVAVLGISLGQLGACKSGDASGPSNDTARKVASIQLSVDSADIALGDTLRLSAVARDASGNPVPGVVLVWTSTNPSVATVSSGGLVTAVSKGETEIDVDVAASTIIVSFGVSADRSAANSEGVALGLPSGPSRGAKITVTPPKSDCDDIASVSNLSSTLTYKYVVEDVTPDGFGRIAAEYHAAVTATLINQGWAPGLRYVTWTGRLAGSATHQETEYDKQNVVSVLDGEGAPLNDATSGASSTMSAIVDLYKCTLKVTATVWLNLTRTDFGKKGSPYQTISAQFLIGRVETAYWKTLGFPEFPKKYPGHSLVFVAFNPTQDAFIPLGLATSLMVATSNELATGEADVSYTLVVVKP